MADMIVAGAGTTAVNGTYVENGTSNGKPLYKFGFYSLFWVNSQWQIRLSLTVRYSSADDVATPDLATFTVTGVGGSGAAPAPTVTAASSSQNLTLSCAEGSYSLTGASVTLTYTPAAQNLTLSCGAGSLALTGTNASLTSARTLICEPASGGAYTDIIVSGAGTTAANGTYVYGGMFQEKPYYLYSDYSIFRVTYEEDELCEWIIVHGTFYEGSPLYSSGEVSYIGVDTPDLVTTWQKVGTGSLPVPTVAAGTSLGYTLTGSDVTLTYTQGAQNLTLACNAGSLALTGTDCTLSVKRNYVLACSAGSYTLTGTNADLTLKRNYTLTCGAGSYSLAGTDVTLTSSRSLTIVSDIIVSWAGTTAANGTYTYAGEGPFGKPYYALGESILSWIGLSINAWVFNWDGESDYYYSTDDVATPDLVTTWQISGGAQLPVPTVTIATTYTLTGSDVTLTYTQGAQNLTLTCEAGSYALTGSSASFEVKRNYTLACNAGSYALSGSAVTFAITRVYSLACNSGSYLLTGTPTSLTSARSLACNSGAYTLTGLEANLFKGLVMPCGAGSYALTGTDASLTSHRIFTLGMGSYVLVGTSVGLFILSPTPACRTATIEYENRTFAIPHENRTATIEYENRTLEVKCH